MHHISVRWLSLQKAVERALLQYPGLKSYFLSNGWDIVQNCLIVALADSFTVCVEESTPRFKRLQKNFEDDMTELYLLFYSHVLCYFSRLNLLLQREEPIIGIIDEQVAISHVLSVSYL